MSQSTADKRFIKEWELQRKGSPVGFFILYTIIWSVILYIATFFFSLVLRTIDISFVVPVIRIAKFVFVGLLITMVFYYKGQYRYYKLKAKASEEL
ncbi:MAG: hypothetical protein JWP69_123 [Flaviaesturariibacter sp.]|nr:hypothetical protein [Flaviaesturariibacter sp.]